MTRRIVLTLMAVVALALPAAAIGKSGYSPWAQPVQTVDPKISELISVFRQTEPAPSRPAEFALIYKPRKDGKTLDGGNPDLARPAYPDAERKQAPVWLVPGANGFLMAWANNGSGGGMGGPVDSEFFRNYGWVGSAGSRTNRKVSYATTVVVPDSIDKVRLVFQRRNGKRFAKDFTPHDNVVVSSDRRFRAAIINGKRFTFPPMTGPRRKR